METVISFPLPWEGNKPKNKVPNRLVEDQRDPDGVELN